MKSTYPSLIFLITCLLGFAACKAPTSQKQNSSSQAQTCIQEIIAQDEALGVIRNHACERISLSETIRDYVDGLAKLNYDSCPKTFTLAFKQHREAWVALVPITDQYPTLRGEMHVLFEQLETGDAAASFKPLVKSIWDTWAEVEEAMKLD